MKVSNLGENIISPPLKDGEYNARVWRDSISYNGKSYPLPYVCDKPTDGTLIVRGNYYSFRHDVKVDDTPPNKAVIAENDINSGELFVEVTPNIPLEMVDNDANAPIVPIQNPDSINEGSLSKEDHFIPEEGSLDPKSDLSTIEDQAETLDTIVEEVPLDKDESENNAVKEESTALASTDSLKSMRLKELRKMRDDLIEACSNSSIEVSEYGVSKLKKDVIGEIENLQILLRGE